MRFEPTPLTGLMRIIPDPKHDERGFFARIHCPEELAKAGLTFTASQINLSRNPARHTLRGLHYQDPPYAEAKIVRAVRGAIFDVAVDVRHGSPTFGRHVGAVISAENWQQIWVPPGFLHGYCTLERDTEVIYKVTAPYDKAAERGVIWNDPALAVPWPIKADQALLSDKDLQLPRLAECPVWFHHS